MCALVLLAPAFRIAERWRARMSDDEWRALADDGLARDPRLHDERAGARRTSTSSQRAGDDRHGGWPDVRVPTLIVHGANDDTVDPQLSRDFARRQAVGAPGRGRRRPRAHRVAAAHRRRGRSILAPVRRAASRTIESVGGDARVGRLPDGSAAACSGSAGSTPDDAEADRERAHLADLPHLPRRHRLRAHQHARHDGARRRAAARCGAEAGARRHHRALRHRRHARRRRHGRRLLGLRSRARPQGGAQDLAARRRRVGASRPAFAIGCAAKRRRWRGCTTRTSSRSTTCRPSRASSSSPWSSSTASRSAPGCASGAAAWREIVEVFKKAGAGLAAAHEAGLVHRDFKPDNVLMSRAGGVLRHRLRPGARARRARRGRRRRRRRRSATSPDVRRSPPAWQTPITVTGALVGTPIYMAPEQLLGTHVDARADVYSFCTALYEALVGRAPLLGQERRGAAPRGARGQLREPDRWRACRRGCGAWSCAGCASIPTSASARCARVIDELGRDPGLRCVASAPSSAWRCSSARWRSCSAR